MKRTEMKHQDDIYEIGNTWGEDIYPQLSWCRMERLQEARVMVVGCGALGNEVLKNLTLFGIGHLYLVDFDTIEPSNLTRSILFSLEDARQHREKALVAAEKIRLIHPGIEVRPFVKDFNHEIGLGLLRQMDVVISCVDNRWARYCINRMCMRVKVPWVDGGIDGLEGTARVFIPGKNCYACNLGPEALKDLSRRLSCSSVVRRNEAAQRVPTTPVVASVIGAVEAQEAIKLLHPEELKKKELTSLCGKMFYYEGQHLTSRLVDFAAYDDDCPVHESWEPIIPTHLSSTMTVKDTLMELAELLQVELVEILLHDFSFVDYLVHRTTEERFETRCPDFDIANFVERHPMLRFVPTHLLYQHEWKTVNADFAYPELTLAQLGIPAWDILPIHTERGTFYVEMSEEY